MTLGDWWNLIVDFTLAGDWNGVLVATDGLQELGEEEVAQGIRTLIWGECYPEYNLHWNNWKFKYRLGTTTHCIWSYNSGAGITHGWCWAAEGVIKSHPYKSNTH